MHDLARKGFILPACAPLLLLLTCCGDSEKDMPLEYRPADPRLWTHEELMEGSRLLEPTETNGIRILYVSGKPYQMGYQQGVLLSDEIAEIQDSLVWKLFYFLCETLRPDGTLSYVEHVRENSLDVVLEECEGMATGSGNLMDVNLCLLHSSGMYIMEDLLNRYFSWLPISLQCSGFIAKDEATSDGGMVHGRNLDWAAIGFIMDNPMVHVRQPENRLRHVSLGWPGMVGLLTAMNEMGIAGQINENSCPREGYRDLTGVPPEQQLLQIMSSARNLEQVEAIIQETEQATCQVMLISDGPGAAGAVYEMWALGYRARYLEDSESGNVVFGTNHLVHPEASQAQGNMDIHNLNEGTVSRYFRLSERLTGRSLPPHPDLPFDDPGYSYGRIDVEEAIDILRDPVDLRPDQGRQAYPCTVHNAGWALGNNHNVHSAIFKGQSLEFWLAAGWDEECQNAIYNPFVGFSLTDLLDGRYTPGRVPIYDPPYNDDFAPVFAGD